MEKGIKRCCFFNVYLTLVSVMHMTPICFCVLCLYGFIELSLSRQENQTLIMKMVPNLMMGQFRIFQLYNGWKGYTFSGNRTLNFEFWSFPGPVIGCLMLPWSWAAAGRAVHGTIRVNQLYCVVYGGQQFLILCFRFHIFSKFQYSTLIYKIGSVLDDFSQL